MKIRSSVVPVNSVLSVILSTEDWSSSDLDSMLAFGEPVVQVGGEFFVNGGSGGHAGEPETTYELRDYVMGRGVNGDTASGRLHPEGGGFTFVLPEREAGIRSGFPVMEQFDSASFEQPELCAMSWRDEVTRRIERALRSFRASSGSVFVESVHEV